MRECPPRAATEEAELTSMRYLSVAEFRRIGYLQELNRQFLHPHGLALEVVVDPISGEESFGQIWDCRNDPEGIRFADELDLWPRATRVLASFMAHARTRVRRFGQVVQEARPPVVVGCWTVTARGEVSR